MTFITRLYRHGTKLVSRVGFVDVAISDNIAIADLLLPDTTNPALASHADGGTPKSSAPALMSV